MSLYDENLDRNIILPILNEYFLIDKGAAAAAIAQSVSLATESQINIASDTFWQVQNEMSMQEYAEETGNSFEFAGGFQGGGVPTEYAGAIATVDPGELQTGPESDDVTPGSSTPSGDDDYDTPLFQTILMDY